MTATTDPFVFYNFGFFIYIVEQSGCSRLIVPKTDVVGHSNVLFVPTQGTTIDNFLPIVPFGDYIGINMHGLSLSINDPSPATLGRRTARGNMNEPDFDWIPDISRTWCGLKLNPDWPQSPAVDSVVELGGGVINALPDAHTCERTWSWTHCDGTVFEGRRITTLTAYEPGSSDLSITVRNTATGTAMAVITMQTDPELPAFFFNLPVQKVTDRWPGQAEVELSHIQAILRLCALTGGELRRPDRTSCPCECETSFKPEARFDKSHPFFDLFLKLLPMHEGTIECSGGSIPNP
jgi:hypothetical protein